MKKQKINIILSILIFLFAGMVLFIVCNKSNQSTPAIIIPLKFVGEYRQNDGEWQTLGEATDLSAFAGDLTLRGRFDQELPEGVNVIFYLNHIGMNVSVNGEDIYEMSNEINADLCGTDWQEWTLPAMDMQDQIVISLHNPHSYGNGNAYNELLSTIFLGNRTQVKQFYEKKELPYRNLCIFILVASIGLIGTAIGYQLMQLPNSTLLLKMGITSLLMGIYMYLDTKDILLRSNRIVFNTYMRQLAIMLAAWVFASGIMELLCQKYKQIAQAAVYLLLCANFAFIAVSLNREIGIYQTSIWWAGVQGIVSLILLVLCILEWKERKKQDRILLLSGIILYATLLAELLNARLSVCPGGSMIKVVFCVLFLTLIVWSVKMVAFNYRASLRAKELEKELRDSRISLAMSQIQPHFIYNSLNTIYHLCEKDVGMTQQAISDFSNYLRRSLSVVDRTTPISFAEELEQVKSYLMLEQLRFGEDLKVEYHIEKEDFMLPALSVQPLVENAVKHGICQKGDGGGTVILTAKESDDCYEVTVSDDGVGFDTGAERNEDRSHVGIRNVRHRLDILCHGTLLIESEPGKGTTSTIRIPKEDFG